MVLGDRDTLATTELVVFEKQDQKKKEEPGQRAKMDVDVLDVSVFFSARPKRDVAELMQLVRGGNALCAIALGTRTGMGPFRELQLVDSRELQSDLNGGENEMRQRAVSLVGGSS